MYLRLLLWMMAKGKAFSFHKITSYDLQNHYVLALQMYKFLLYFSLDMQHVALLALTDHASQKWDEIFNFLKIHSFDRFDYAAMKYMILLNPGTKISEQLSKNQQYDDNLHDNLLLSYRRIPVTIFLYSQITKRSIFYSLR